MALRAVIVAVMALVAAAGASSVLLVVLAFLFTTAATPCYPALAAAVPATLDAANLAAGNALLTGVETLAFIAGPAAGGAVLLVASPSTALALNAVVFVIALALSLRLARAPATRVPERSESLVRSAVSGARVIASSGEVAAPVLLVIVVNAVYGGALVGLILVADRLLRTGDAGFGLLNTGLGIGACLGVAGTNRLAMSRRPLSTLMATTLLAVVRSPELAFVLMMVAGAGSVLTEIFAVTLVQRAVGADVIARVFGMLDSLIFGAIFLGSVSAPLLVHLMGLRGSLVLIGAVLPVTAVLGARRLHDDAVRATQATSALQSRVELLASVSWLGDALQPTLEALAAYATDERVAPGTRIIVQGDTPDDFFVLVRGHVQILKAAGEAGDRVVNVLGPGSGFGEIGLLEGVPRTATVVATEPVELLRVDGPRFVGAMNAVRLAAGGALGGGILGRLGGGATEPRRRSSAQPT